MRKFNIGISLSLGTALNSMVARMTGGGGQSQPQGSIPVMGSKTSGHGSSYSNGPPNIPPPYVNQAPKPKLFTKRRAKDQTIKSLRSSGRWGTGQRIKRKDRRRASAAGDRHAFK